MNKELFIDNSILRIIESNERIIKCLHTLTEKQIWIKPNENLNSIANLIIHLSGNITQYIISSLGNNPDNRQRNLEFIQTNTYSKIELENMINSVTTNAILIIKKCSSNDLNNIKTVQGFTLSGSGIIIHVVEHLSYHTGQISFFTKLLTNSNLGFYDDFDLSVKNK